MMREDEGEARGNDEGDNKDMKVVGAQNRCISSSESRYDNIYVICNM